MDVMVSGRVGELARDCKSRPYGVSGFESHLTNKMRRWSSGYDARLQPERRGFDSFPACLDCVAQMGEHEFHTLVVGGSIPPAVTMGL